MDMPQIEVPQQVMDVYSKIPKEVIDIAVRDFDLTMFVVAMLFILLHRLVASKQTSKYEIVYRWLAFFSLGVVGIYTFAIHAFYPDMVTQLVGWRGTVTNFQVAIAELAFGVLGILSFSASVGFRLATVLGASIWLLGNACYQIVLLGNDLNIATAGSWLWLQDIVIPLLLLACVNRLRKHHQ